MDYTTWRNGGAECTALEIPVLFLEGTSREVRVDIPLLPLLLPTALSVDVTDALVGEGIDITAFSILSLSFKTSRMGGGLLRERGMKLPSSKSWLYLDSLANDIISR